MTVRSPTTLPLLLLELEQYLSSVYSRTGNPATHFTGKHRPTSQRTDNAFLETAALEPKMLESQMAVPARMTLCGPCGSITT